MSLSTYFSDFGCSHVVGTGSLLGTISDWQFSCLSQDTSVLSPSFPVLILMVLSHYIYGSSPSQIMQTSPLVGALLFGLLCAKLTINLVVSVELSRIVSLASGFTVNLVTSIRFYCKSLSLSSGF